MTVEMNWHEGDEQAGLAWDRPAEPLPVAVTPAAAIAQGRVARRGPSRLTLLLAGMAIGVAIGLAALAALLMWRANQGSQLAQRDVSAAAAQLLEAQAAGDVQRYATLLDSSDPVWKARLVAGLRNPANIPPAQWNVEEVRLDGPLAEAEVTETDDAGGQVRRLVYFHLIDGQWRLAPPEPGFFGAERSTSSPHFRISYRERDQRFVAGLINLAEGAYVALCGELRCSAAGRPLELHLIYDASADLPAPAPGVVAVASPGLLGLRVDGQPGPAFEQQVAGQIAAQLAWLKAPGASTALLQVVHTWAAAEFAGQPDLVDDTLASALQAQQLLPLDRVWDAVVHGNADDRLFLSSMASVLAFVQSAWGNDAVGRLLESASGSLDDMTRRAFQVDSESFERLWLAWLAQQSIPAAGTSTG